MAIQLAASQLKNNLNTTIRELIRERSMTMTRREERDAPAVTTEFALGAILREGFMGSILKQVNQLLHYQQFRELFDIKYQMRVMFKQKDHKVIFNPVINASLKGNINPTSLRSPTYREIGDIREQ